MRTLNWVYTRITRDTCFYIIEKSSLMKLKSLLVWVLNRMEVVMWNLLQSLELCMLWNEMCFCENTPAAVGNTHSRVGFLSVNVGTKRKKTVSHFLAILNATLVESITGHKAYYLERKDCKPIETTNNKIPRT